MSNELTAHVHRLANELGVIVLPYWVIDPADCDETPCGAAGHISFEVGGSDPMVWISEEPATAEAYLIALHELGHHATEGDSLYDRETDAWTWAEEKSLIPITPHLRAFIERRLDTYRD